MDIFSFIKDNKLKIIVKPNSSKNEVLGEDKGRLKVAIKAEPEKGKANKELIKFFRKLTKSEVRIVSGLKSRKKMLKIGNI